MWSSSLVTYTHNVNICPILAIRLQQGNYSAPSKFPIQESVWQWDTISGQLFAARLEGVLGKLKWRRAGAQINGECLSTPRFADGTVLFSQTSTEIAEHALLYMLASLVAGLKVNMQKIKGYIQ